VSIHLPLVPNPPKDIFFPPVLQFFKYTLIIQGGSTLGTSCKYISCFKQINPLPHYLLIL
jgi:hypothetical protein